MPSRWCTRTAPPRILRSPPPPGPSGKPWKRRGLIAGEESSYGLYVETVDGETADEGNQEWWCLTKGGEMWNYGVDDTQIEDGDAFEFTLTVGY